MFLSLEETVSIHCQVFSIYGCAVRTVKWLSTIYTYQEANK